MVGHAAGCVDLCYVSDYVACQLQESGLTTSKQELVTTSSGGC
jgi:hypothetical protein